MTSSPTTGTRIRRSFSPLARLPWLGNLLGAGPLPVAPHAFALTAKRLSYAGFARDDSGFQLREQHRENLPEDAFHSGLLGGPLREPASFALSVKRLVERISVPVKEASLVIPDTWMRVAFTEVEELPQRAEAREEVLRWKLKRLVPFPVDEVRLDAMPVPALPGRTALPGPGTQPGRTSPVSQIESGRILLGFAIDQLLTQVEEAFAASGIRLGRITNESLATLSALASWGAGAAPGSGEGSGGLTALVLVEDTGYALLVVRGSAPLLHRFKSLTVPVLPPGESSEDDTADLRPAPADADAADLDAALAGIHRELSRGGVALDGSALDRLITRDLVLTRNFLSEQAPGAQLERALLLAPPADEGRWLDWLARGLDVPVEPIGAQHLVPMTVAGPSPTWREVTPLLGAVREEVVH